MDQENQEVQETQGAASNSTIDNLEDALKEVAKLRRENAARRTKANEVEEAAAKWREHVEKSKTDLERLTGEKTEAARLADERAEEANRLRVMLEYKLDKDFEGLLVGSKEQMEQIAKLLQGKATNGTTTDFFAGRRGTAVGSTQDENVNDTFRQWIKTNASKGGS